jgi:hypothetical protein
MPGQIKLGFGTLIGNAGEYYVVAELLSRNVIAALAPRNAPAFDILATQGTRTVRIRVKTRTAENDDWQWNAKKDGTIFRFLDKKDDFTVLVHFTPEHREHLGFWIVPTVRINEWLTHAHQEWVDTPGKNGRPHDASNVKRHLQYRVHSKALAKYSEAWDSLWR